VFPTNSILDHVPVLIEQIARYVGASDDDIVANTFVVAKARELGELRYRVVGAPRLQLLTIFAFSSPDGYPPAWRCFCFANAGATGSTCQSGTEGVRGFGV
jgi:hypothetical protein